MEFTEQQWSAHAGGATFWAWLHGTEWIGLLRAQLPHRQPTSNNHVFQALVTRLPTHESPLAVWRHHHGRADCENVIKETFGLSAHRFPSTPVGDALRRRADRS